MGRDLGRWAVMRVAAWALIRRQLETFLHLLIFCFSADAALPSTGFPQTQQSNYEFANVYRCRNGREPGLQSAWAAHNLGFQPQSCTIIGTWFDRFPTRVFFLSGCGIFKNLTTGYASELTAALWFLQ
ncbi:hypothetical protein BDW60DRAFT_127749 [Aspergillus nidulans var. acristatus]